MLRIMVSLKTVNEFCLWVSAKTWAITFEFPKKQTKENLTLRHILDVPPEVSNNVDWALSPQALDMIRFIPEGGSWKDVPYEH